MKFCVVVRCGDVEDVLFRMLGVFVMLWFMLLFLFGVLVLMVFDYLNGMWMIVLILLVVLLFVVGWKWLSCCVCCVLFKLMILLIMFM